MKTPREILLARHRAAGDKLDAIRQSVIAREVSGVAPLPRNSQSWWLRCLSIPWQELFLPSRRVWSALAAVWILIFVVNISQRDPINRVTGRPEHAPAVMMSWQVQQQLMSQLLAERSTPVEADRPQNSPPRPRTQNRGNTLIHV